MWRGEREWLEADGDDEIVKAADNTPKQTII